MDCFVARAPLRKRFAFVAGNDGGSLQLLQSYFSKSAFTFAKTLRNMSGVSTRVLVL
jgi:hypothetical protein